MSGETFECHIHNIKIIYKTNYLENSTKIQPSLSSAGRKHFALAVLKFQNCMSLLTQFFRHREALRGTRLCYSCIRIGVYQHQTGKHLNVRVHLTKPYDYTLKDEIQRIPIQHRQVLRHSLLCGIHTVCLIPFLTCIIACVLWLQMSGCNTATWLILLRNLLSVNMCTYHVACLIALVISSFVCNSKMCNKCKFHEQTEKVEISLTVSHMTTTCLFSHNHYSGCVN